MVSQSDIAQKAKTIRESVRDELDADQTSTVEQVLKNSILPLVESGVNALQNGDYKQAVAVLQAAYLNSQQLSPADWVSESARNDFHTDGIAAIEELLNYTQIH